MDPSEVEFLAERELVKVIPNFTHDKIYLISGDVGPFSAGLPLPVPLWLAVNLKQRQKCRFVAPDWMDIDVLKEKKQEEADSRFFTPMPSPHYMEITQLLLQWGTDDIPKADEIRTLVKDIWDLRIAKLRSSIDVFVKSGESHAKLNYLTLMEINTVRLFLTKALNHMHQLKSVTSRDTTNSNSQAF
ncbi:DNA replication complex GINS protein PSF2 [Biomphalaria glabrata]|uniref:DNA replication complex GINS protein PSF2 n=2 Tax=Biomphalaria TaxID=6525 RepID=A0A2C9JNB1_BIOGL|nr:DNA replication complex GINS protein PSF2-like [Biomphalaria glabrata]XP_055890464.1 DNA replication complex GINS protein PSF2-like [Biomphalaria glabrata]XP_055890465.1 DNA replication complex GINS protein PSF2-like [Biomphalaria glabrata]KAK0060850.1 DNA replication complex GINS protein PSF2 [Biomphalaria pfeifferi]KAI8725986.1 DNA replication complex GINS protein PSF2-like [Biomphalaria glabrata]KAI8763075.1 DNA replication complex GINS protein PSF2-like [Biomphalaria glabrata]KAI879086